MSARDTASSYGITIAIDDLGDWGSAELRSEYDPSGPAIRINERVVRALPWHQRERFIERAIGHELYHHREHVGDVALLSPREAREAAADAYARSLTERE
jgi:hypothetical protein